MRPFLCQHWSTLQSSPMQLTHHSTAKNAETLHKGRKKNNTNHTPRKTHTRTQNKRKHMKRSKAGKADTKYTPTHTNTHQHTPIRTNTHQHTHKHANNFKTQRRIKGHLGTNKCRTVCEGTQKNSNGLDSEATRGLLLHTTFKRLFVRDRWAEWHRNSSSE